MSRLLDFCKQIINSDWFQSLYKSALPLSTGFAGSLSTFLLALPLSALLGPMLVNGFLSLSGIKMHISRLFLPPTFVTIGIYIGSKMEPNSLDKLIGWLPSVLLLIVWMVLATAIAAYYLHKYAKFDKLSAVYSAMPGAFANILESSRFNGLVDQRKIVISQTLRIFLVISLLPILLSLDITAFQVVTNEIQPTQEQLFRPWQAWSLCFALIIIIIIILRRSEIPAPYLVGGLIGSGVFFATGQLNGALPNPPLIIALYILGSVIGTRFAGFLWRELFKILVYGLISSFILLIVSVVGAFVTSWLLNINFISLLLSFIPGGINEISIIAYTYGIDPALVVFLHFIRILLITFSLPFIPAIIGFKVPSSPAPINQPPRMNNNIATENIHNLDDDYGEGPSGYTQSNSYSKKQQSDTTTLGSLDGTNIFTLAAPTYSASNVNHNLASDAPSKQDEQQNTNTHTQQLFPVVTELRTPYRSTRDEDAQQGPAKKTNIPIVNPKKKFSSDK